MTTARWERVKELFDNLRRQQPERRRALLEEACGDDHELRGEVESLLNCFEQAGDFMQKPAVPGREPADRMLGRRIGPYLLVSRIGQGGMGAVYMAARADEEFRKRVAIKLIRTGLDGKDILRRFRTERQTLAVLDHPNIVKLLDGGSNEDGFPYLVMDYVEGDPIDVYCDNRKLTINQRLELFRTVCGAVQYAHSSQVVHRDLKPSNILVTSEGVPKLLDFGIAKLLKPEMYLDPAAITHSDGVRPMTPKYASPEQIRGEPITPATDVYSLGVVLYELLTRHYPYRVGGDTPAEIQQAVCHEEAEKPSAAVVRREILVNHEATTDSLIKVVKEPREENLSNLRKRLRGDLDLIVLMALRKEPQRRYESVAQFSEDIRRNLARLPVIARADSIAYRARKFAARNKGSAIRTALAALALVVVLAVLIRVAVPVVWTYFWPSSITAERGTIAVFPIKNLSNDPKQETLASGITEALIASLAKISGFKVYQGNPKGLRQNPVETLLEGGILQSADGIRLEVRLGSASTRQQLWAESYDSQISRIFDLFGKIALDVAEADHVSVTAQERRRLVGSKPVNPEAYDAYLQGRFWFNRRTAEGFQRAIENFEIAIAKDRADARSYAGLADVYCLLGSTPYNARAPRQLFPQALEWAQKAVAIDDSQAEGHASLGMVKLTYELDARGAEIEFKRALELNEGYATAHHWYAGTLLALGRIDAAQVEFARAQELDPFSPVIAWGVGWGRYFAKNNDGAIDQYQRALDQMDPLYVPLHCSMSLAYSQKGLHQQAETKARRAVELMQAAPYTHAALGSALALGGRKQEAHAELDKLAQLARTQYVGPMMFAFVYTSLGETDAAFQWLDTACQDSADYIVNLKTDPVFSRLGSDPRLPTPQRCAPAAVRESLVR